jgi:hypothetical protein
VGAGFGVSFDPRVDEAERAIERDDSLEADCAEGVPSIPIESELRRELEAAGIQPASPVTVSLSRKMSYNRILEAAGIAPASPNSQILTQESSCGNPAPPCLHIACTYFGLRELVVCWHLLTPDVRETIVKIARGQGDFSLVGE